MKVARCAAAVAGAVGAIIAVAACTGGTGRTSSATSGGASSGTAASGTISVVMARYSSRTAPYWTALVRRFEKQYPTIRVNLRVVDWATLSRQVTAMTRTRSYPDVLNFDAYARFASAGLLRPADQVLSPSVVADFLPSLVRDDSIHGVQYAIPWVASVRALGYNKQAFAKARIAGPPAMWAQLVADARKAKKAGYIGYCLPLGPDDTQAEWSLWMWSNGGGWTDPAGRWTINSPPNLQALEFLRDLALTYKVTEPNPGGTDRISGCWADFAAGKVAMTQIEPVGTFATTVMKRSTVQWGAAPWPRSSLSVAPFTLGQQDVLLAFRKPGNTTMVRDFLDFVYQTTNYLTFVRDEGYLPVTKSAGHALATNPMDADAVKLLSIARFYPTSEPDWSRVRNAVRSRLGAVMNPHVDPARLLDGLQRIAQSSGSAAAAP